MEALTAALGVGAPCEPPDAAWFRWNGDLWATNGHVLINDSVTVCAAGWATGISAATRRELFDRMGGSRWRNCNEIGPRCQLDEDNNVGVIWRQDGLPVAVDACYWSPVFAALAVEQGDDWRGPVRCLNHRRKVFAYVMPLDYEPAELEVDVERWEACRDS